MIRSRRSFRILSASAKIDVHNMSAHVKRGPQAGAIADGGGGLVGTLPIARERWQRRADPAAEAPAPRRWSRRWALWLTLGYLGQVALRLWLSRSQSVPLANPDESAYLVIARVLAHAGAASD